MSHNTIRNIAAGIAVAAVAAVSLGTEKDAPPAYKGDPSVPSAWEVLHAHDGRGEGNERDLTY